MSLDKKVLILFSTEHENKKELIYSSIYSHVQEFFFTRGEYEVMLYIHIWF